MWCLILDENVWYKLFYSNNIGSFSIVGVKNIVIKAYPWGIPLIREMSHSDKGFTVFAEKSCHASDWWGVELVKSSFISKFRLEKAP